MASITLPPTAPLSFTVDLTAAQAPYFSAWYTALKLPVETPSAFLVRILKPTVVDWAAQNEMRLAQDAAKAVMLSVQAEAVAIKSVL